MNPTSRIRSRISYLLAATLLCASAFAAADQPRRDIVKIGGHPVSVWSRTPASFKYSILLIHGRTWSALPDFDLHLPQHRSVMQALAARGYATYAVDLRGYGATPRNTDGWNAPNEAAAMLQQMSRIDGD